MDPSSAIQIVILVVLLFLSGIFSASETAMTMFHTFRIRALADDGNKRAKVLLDITENKRSKMLSAILIGNNIVNISASSLAATLAYKSGGYMVGIVTAALTLAILVFGEITPKNLAAIHADKLALFFTPLIRFCMFILTPFIFIINGIAMGLLFLFRVDIHAKDEGMTEDDLRTLVGVGHEDGAIESDEKEMIYNVFDLGDAKAKDVMVPRVHVTFVDAESTYDELLALFREDKYTRFPVYEDTTDNIIGTINVKDLLLYDNVERFRVRDIMREPYFTYEYKDISELLVEMRDASYNIAVVLDEYGETAGLITLEDILEEIVGEIHDEYDENEEEFLQEINDHEYLVEGSTNMDDLNDRLGLNLESSDYDSVGGYIIEHLDRLPEVGDEIATEDGIHMVVESLEKNRIQTVHLYLPIREEETEEDEAEKEEKAAENH